MQSIIAPLQSGDRGLAVANLQDALQLFLDRGVITLGEDPFNLPRKLKEERTREVYESATASLVQFFQVNQPPDSPISATGNIDELTAKAINRNLLNLGVLETFQVSGKVRSLTSVAVGNLRVQIVDKTIGGDILLASVRIRTDGSYSLTLENTWLQRGKTKPDLQAQVRTTVPNSDPQEMRLLASSEVRYNASSNETSLNIVLPATATTSLPSEHTTLLQDLTTHFQGNLRELKEDDNQQDITYLANKSGWDARAVAIASLADQFSVASEIDPAFFYTLFRAGLPANEEAIYQINPKTAESVWKQGIKQGLIPATLEAQLPQTLDRFKTLAVQRTLAAPAVTGVSSLKEMLNTSRITDVVQQERFVRLYADRQDNLPQFWEAVQQEFGAAVAQRLRVDGQLGFLTLNNAPLIQQLNDTDIPSPVSLIEDGFYRAEKWKTLLSDGIDIPPEIPGANDAEKLNNYAEVMAAQMRLSYPTAVVAQMARSGETPLTNPVGEQIHALLTAQQGKFEIGLQPIEQYTLQNNIEVVPAVMQEVTRIQRVHQITPSDRAMNGLLRNNLDSAYKIVQYDRATFVRQFQEELGGETTAILTHAKAQQVHNTVLNIATTYLTGRNALAIGSNPNGLIINSQAAQPTDVADNNTSDIIAYPTLEDLFTEMDYCTCDHCRSILSPAAYLVNLLEFCDSEKNGTNPPVVTSNNPQTVLLNRRPDIQHLPLTCENTNTPLPYIDIVNETLEYFVTNNQNLENYTGHDTDLDVTPEELLASPQFVSDRAYETLAGEPPAQNAPLPLLPPSSPLPFHQSLENLRRYFDKFETPLPHVMQVLRKNDALERTREIPYGWRDILMEELRISRAEYQLLTDRTLTLQQIYGYSPTTPEAEILSTLANAKTFTRRVGISYEDLIEIIKTRFVNSNADLLPKLERLNIPFTTLKALKDGTIADADFDAKIPPGFDATPYGGNIKAWVRNETNYIRITSLITLTNPTTIDDPCSFDQLELRYSNPDNDTNRLLPIEFVRLLRFIRLWKKLGWTIAQTDQAIMALNNRATASDTPGTLDAGFLTFLPRLGIIKQVMDRLHLNLQQDLQPLLACFAPINTYGRSSLYHQMFLSPALLKQDPVFAENGLGKVLTDSTQKIGSHIEILRAALQLTDDELRQIMTSLGFNDSIEPEKGTPLNLSNLSAMFRRGWLARKLKLSVREFLLLTQFTSLDPFATPDPFIPAPPALIAPPDPINPPIQGLIELVYQLRALSLKPSQALYLIWNQDISGKSTPNDREIIDFARSLRAELTAIDVEYSLIDDPDGQIARSKMALVYGNDATDRFFGLLGNTLVSTVENYSQNQATLDPTILATAKDRIAYDDFRKQLSFKGVMTENLRDTLKAVSGVSSEFKEAIDKLYAENQKVIQPFFTRYPELLPLYDVYVASNAPEEQKRSALLANFLPELKRRRKQQQVLQSMSATTKVEAEMADALLNNADVLHAISDPVQPAFNDPIAIETSGLSAKFFFRETATGNVDSSSDAYSKLPENTAAPNSPISGIWSGYLEAPENGFFNLSIEADAGATVSLTLEGKAITLTPSQDGNQWENTQAIDLRAGTLYAIALTVEKVKDTLKVRWETSGRGLEVIPVAYLYSNTLMGNLRVTYIRFLKVTALATALKLTASEMAHLADRANYQIGGQGWLNSLPVNGSPAIATAIDLRRAFTTLLDFAHLKSELSPDDERLLTVLQTAVQPESEQETVRSLLFSLTRWEAKLCDALLSHFDIAIADLKDSSKFRRLFHAYKPLKTFGISASALINATTNDPSTTTVRNLQSALRARYSESDWLNVLKPINDEMRWLQRDALVAYILHQMRQNIETQHIDTPDKLFEYFLMDVQMEPCMKTSRIRHALSSIQLFIERCLMNLETNVSPSSINAKQWAWMKRYRVWEANRKVFLYPENWLEPELRDDQSPFFKEAMSELLQGDITEDRAAVTLLNYLSKLEEVAKLEPCGIHFVENDLSKLEDDVAHVVARTAGASRKYFYRRREFGNWTPWEQIKLDIEDNPVIPVVWRDRLFLFWLRILKQAPLDAENIATSSDSEPEEDLSKTKPSKFKKDAQKAAANTKITVQAVLCWSEYYNSLSDKGTVVKKQIYNAVRQDIEFTYTFENFFHPFVGDLIQRLNKESLADMLDPTFLAGLDRFSDADKAAPNSLFKLFKDFDTAIDNNNLVKVEGFSKDIDLRQGGAYANYNWELFFHIPLTIAVHLSKNQRFAEAQRWFHLIFDPTCTDNIPTPQRFWKFLAFRQAGDVMQIDELLRLLSKPDPTPEEEKIRQSILDGYEASKNKPFQPHAVARTRQIAYQYSVVMKYLDNLIAWGDSLFRQDTIETINEATQIYVLAANLLGPRPQKIPSPGTIRPKTFAQLKSRVLDPTGNALVELEGKFPLNLGLPQTQGTDPDSAAPLFGIGRTLYFCIPQNDKLLGYWDTVGDRLFKIRHCMNIEGIFRQLALFDPPLDPGMLVKAAAAGIDIGSIVNGLNQPVSPVRAILFIQKAMELCGEVRNLGGALLSAIEKGEGEKLALLRQSHEIKIQQMQQDVRFLQWKQAEEATKSLLTSRATALERLHYYQRLLGLPADPNAPNTVAIDRRELTEENFDAAYSSLVDQYQKSLTLQKMPSLQLSEESSTEITSGASGSGKLYLSKNEATELNVHLPNARNLTTLSSTYHTAATTLTPIPDTKADLHYWGIGATIDFKTGTALSAVARIYGDITGIFASLEREQANIVSRSASYERRADEWLLQHNSAAHELMQIGRQILTSLISEQIARHEYENTKKQIENAQEVDRFLQEKFTNEELYSWMQGEISRLYYEYYRFAFDTARKAEQTMKRELMRSEVDATTYIKFNYWDGGRKGLLSGEALYLDLKRMEMAYHENNKREYELTKHISLLQVSPLALLQLRTTGRCTISLPEELFDLDGPGHYFRRIKTVAISIPCVAGPYTSINCTLTMLKSSIRTKPLLGDDYQRSGSEDERFNDSFGSLQTIVTSTGQNDSGLFETNLRDERYLPFEGAGVISEWQLQLPANPSEEEPCQFDYDTISDAILHIRYTARETGETLKKEAIANLKTLIDEAQPNSFVRLFSIRHEFPTEWAKFKNVQIGTATPAAELTFTLQEEHYPFWSKGNVKTIKQANLFVDSRTTETVVVSYQADGGGDRDTLAPDAAFGNLRGGNLANLPISTATGKFTLYLINNSLEDIWLAIAWGKES